MGQRGNIMSFRPDIKVLDATLRDGGLVNSFQFSDEFVKDLYAANVKAGVDYMEFGYKADREMFDPDRFGKWKFCNDDDIYAIVGDNPTDMKIAVMADVGRTNYKRDIPEKANRWTCTASLPISTPCPPPSRWSNTAINRVMRRR